MILYLKEVSVFLTVSQEEYDLMDTFLLYCKVLTSNLFLVLLLLQF